MRRYSARLLISLMFASCVAHAGAFNADDLFKAPPAHAKKPVAPAPVAHVKPRTTSLARLPRTGVHSAPKRGVAVKTQLISASPVINPFSGKRLNYEQKMRELDNQRLNTQIMGEQLKQDGIKSAIEKLRYKTKTEVIGRRASVPKTADARITALIGKLKREKSLGKRKRHSPSPSPHSAAGPRVSGEISFGRRYYRLVENRDGSKLVAESAMDYAATPGSVSTIRVSDRRPAPVAGKEGHDGGRPFIPGVATSVGTPIMPTPPPVN
ncbi:MAG TPA: hypothetical protein DEP05_01810 [Betaproteobacteria bacterium]|nr:hypothetical protein [Betaproteobacteria bacterium]